MSQRLTNFNSPDNSSSPRELINANGTFYFIADKREVFGEIRKLWTLDLATGQPVLVGSTPDGFFHTDNLTLVNGVLYFTAFEQPAGSRGLWKIDPATGVPISIALENIYLDNLTAINNTLYFSAYDNEHGTELWKLNPTTNTPIRLTDINPGGGDSSPSNFVALNGTIYFFAYNGNNTQLWKLDPSTGNAVQATGTAFTNGPSRYGEHRQVVINNTLYFIATVGNSPQVLKLDPTTDTITPVTNFNPTPPGSYGQIQELITINGVLYFTRLDTANGDTLWRLNPATNLPTLVTNIASESYTYNLTQFNNTLYFSTNDGTHGEELWKIDATGNPVRISDINSGAGSATPSNFTNINGTLYFNADDGTHGNELWKLNAADTPVRLGDINPGSGSSFHPLFRSNPVNVNGTIYFRADDGATGVELWQLNPTTGSTALVKNLNLETLNPPGDLTSFNGSIYFGADDGVHGYELWRLDAATGNPVLISDLNPGMGSSNPFFYGGEAGNYYSSYRLTNVNGTLYFLADDGTHGIELWQLDPATGTPTLITDFAPDNASGGGEEVRIWSLINNNGTLYFVAKEGTSGDDLWKLDAVTGNPVRLNVPVEGDGNNGPYNLTSINGILYFTLYQENGIELWRVDPTTGNPVRLNLDSVSSSRYLRDFKNVNGTLQFKASDYGADGYELWQIDVATGKPVFLKEVDLRSVGGRSREEAIANDSIYFPGYTPQLGYELTKYDPATGSLTQFDLNLGSGGISLYNDTCLGVKSRRENIFHRGLIRPGSL